MFFSVSTKKYDKRFLNYYNLFGYYLSLDQGWQLIEKNNSFYLYKGYSDYIDIESIIEKSLLPFEYSGNFCIIKVEKNLLTIMHDSFRSFPLQYNQEYCTNLIPIESFLQPVWSDSYISICNNQINTNRIDIDYSIEKINKDLLLDIVQEKLRKKCRALTNLSSPIKLFLSGGIDTTLVYCLLDDAGVDFEFVTEERFEFTEFNLKNIIPYRNKNSILWGYKQFHHWKSTVFYASGCLGDETFMRSPGPASLWAAWHGINILENISQIEYSYHKKYFLRSDIARVFQENWNNRKKIQEQFCTHQELNKKIIDTVLNDHQHWHLENTISWTPLKDIEILKLILGLPKEDILDQMLFGSLDRELISRFDRKKLEIVGTDKNHNAHNNLVKQQFFKDLINAM